MASQVGFIFLFAIILIGGLVLLSPLLASSGTKVKNSSIAVNEISEFLKEFQRASSDKGIFMLDNHYSLMTFAASYGGRLYDLSVDVSLDCSKTIRAATLSVENLTVGRQAYQAIHEQVHAVVVDLLKAQQLAEHPLELFCEGIAKRFSQSSSLKGAFEKAKLEAAKFDFAARGRHPAYSGKLLQSSESVQSKMLDMWAVPEFARLTAAIGFAKQLDPNGCYSVPIHFFAKSCQAVARFAQFAQPMKILHAKVLDETVTEIAAADRAARFAAAIDKGGLYWIPKMMNTFYKHITSDRKLKKELDKQSALIGSAKIFKFA